MILYALLCNEEWGCLMGDRRALLAHRIEEDSVLLGLPPGVRCPQLKVVISCKHNA